MPKFRRVNCSIDKAIKEENYAACRAIIPMLQAEEAERFVKEWRTYLDEEARIMKNVPGWEDGQPELEYKENLRAIKEEKDAACRAIIPLLQAEMDERFVKERRKYLDEVARIMKDDPGWKVGPSVYNSGRWMPTATGELRHDVWSKYAARRAIIPVLQAEEDESPFAPSGSAAVGVRSKYAARRAIIPVLQAEEDESCPFVPLGSAVGARAFIPVLQAEERERFVKEWRKYLYEEPRIVKDVPASKVDQSVRPHVRSPSSFAGFSQIQSGRGLTPAAVGARCYSQETGENYNHIEQKRIYRAKKGQEPILRTLAQVKGWLRLGEAVQIFYNGEKVSLIDVDLPPEDDIMGKIYLAGGLVFRASQVVMD